MASFLKLSNEPLSMKQEIVQMVDDAERMREVEYHSAVKIQSWFRGLRTRLYLRHLTSSAILIQRHWRGYMGRAFFRVRVRNLVMIMRMNFYHAMAVRVQRRWRGFRTRKYQHNFYARQRYFDALAIKNQIVRYELDEYREQLESDVKRRAIDAEERKLQYEARKCHYLVSTAQVKGVYNSPYRRQPHEMEARLRQARPLSPLSRKPSPPPNTAGLVDYASVVMKPRPPGSLPPLDDRKPQGPFRSPHEVRRQRYRPLNPTLRVQTDFYSLERARGKLKREEWCQRLGDVPWLAFRHRRAPYQPLLQSASDYLPFGHNQLFGEEDRSKDVSAERYRTVASPVPVFDRFKETYSKGQVMLQ